MKNENARFLVKNYWNFKVIFHRILNKLQGPSKSKSDVTAQDTRPWIWPCIAWMNGQALPGSIRISQQLWFSVPVLGASRFTFWGSKVCRLSSRHWTARKRWGNLFRSPQRTACNHEEAEGLSQRNVKAFLGKKAGGFLLVQEKTDLHRTKNIRIHLSTIMTSFLKSSLRPGIVYLQQCSRNTSLGHRHLPLNIPKLLTSMIVGDFFFLNKTNCFFVKFPI